MRPSPITANRALKFSPTRQNETRCLKARDSEGGPSARRTPVAPGPKIAANTQCLIARCSSVNKAVAIAPDNHFASWGLWSLVSATTEKYLVGNQQRQARHRVKQNRSFRQLLHNSVTTSSVWRITLCRVCPGFTERSRAIRSQGAVQKSPYGKSFPKARSCRASWGKVSQRSHTAHSPQVRRSGPLPPLLLET